MKRPPLPHDPKRCSLVPQPRKIPRLPKILRPYKGHPRWRVTA